MDIQPIAYFESPLKSKFGIPRQSGLVDELTGRIVFEKPFRQVEAVRGLEDFDYLWLIWEFSANKRGVGSEECGVRNLTVRPPRLGGNRRMGVFATRSPFRPNPIGLSCVRIDRVEEDRLLGPVIYVRGADLMDGTPIFDIKPYVAYADAHAEARSGFVDEKRWEPLHVEIPDMLAVKIPVAHREALKATLAQDPRPAFHDDPERTYGMPFLNMDVRFRVKDGVLTVVECAGAPKVGARLTDDDTVEEQQ
ncbi:MAG: tRNA (N6-threonylcarbamoyladenosine(37)-N6)-methyltransferase TrmO [Prevotella sp.]|nr:tRNA (N6-threonylcarbamoyladenosine(37)-N6)-methyltransferase TrmO [Prevotella sp.]